MIQEEEPMKEGDAPNKLGNNTIELRWQDDQYHSVEFFVKGMELPYQFKIWNTASMPMCVLVKENSAVLPLLKVGDTLDMRFYSGESVYDTDSLRTTIRHITKDEGRFKGHYLVALEILRGPSQEGIH